MVSKKVSLPVSYDMQSASVFIFLAQNMDELGRGLAQGDILYGGDA